MKISKNLAVCMINFDYSGLNESEIELVREFPDFQVTDWNDESSDINARCSITGQWDCCVDIELSKDTK